MSEIANNFTVFSEHKNRSKCAAGDGRIMAQIILKRLSKNFSKACIHLKSQQKIKLTTDFLALFS